jgi:hypothetical protein
MKQTCTQNTSMDQLSLEQSGNKFSMQVSSGLIKSNSRMNIKNLFFAILLGSVFLTACDKDDDTTTSTTGQTGEVSGTWKKGSTIVVTGHLVIPEGETLTIEEGVTVLMCDTSAGQEILVYGNLYCKGTESNPVTFTVPDSLLRSGNFPRVWGGFICAPSCQEFLMLYTHVEYTGYVTTESSPSVIAGLFKAEAGEGLPAVNFRNETDGKLVIEHCTFNNIGEDGLYLEGGDYIIQHNTFYTTGETGGDAINLKSGSIADVCYNLVYSPNTNALKLSNSGDRTPQCNPICYNNTIVNCGWRRAKVKGGGIWLEEGVNAVIYNNMHINCRFAVKNDEADERSVYDYNYYYGYTQECVNNFQDTVDMVVRGEHDVAGTTAGENDPLLVNYPLSNSQSSATFNTSWDFHLSSGSPALTGAYTDFDHHFGSTGITIDGTTYTADDPSAYYGAFGTN